MQTKNRPVFLDLQVLTRHLPIPGIVSIMHRISGVVLFMLLPALLALLAGSLSNGETFATYKAWADNGFIKLILWLVLWAYIHHLFAGIRFLLIDAHIGVELQTARKSARIVLIGAAIVAFVLGIVLW
ncbi:MAG: succinate dehydrogenase, cytochrome b556 subunit [Alysiella sp.]|uniref:succinate dehydrogenase, cytochrome b556 subunit n=1 Tax=Alysiella sp. TaxID=1872483 RepID=UPI0026DD7863|nr:succinate dehydrogenase, cytochrome b556 subunit [Alysiella sp.]MDO4433371.1 succinate dehydrogenase, cytochrome b556 subunit [Alysiella sp.]